MEAARPKSMQLAVTADSSRRGHNLYGAHGGAHARGRAAGGRARRAGAVRVYAEDKSTPNPVLSKKALKRIKSGEVTEKDMRRVDGVIYREQMGEPDDIRLPKFSNMTRMDYGEFLTAVKDGQTSTVEMWRDKEPYWFPPWRQYFKGQRAVVTLKSGEIKWVDMPLQEFEEVGAKYLSKFEVDVGYHQPPGRDGMTPLDLALLAGAAGTFVLSSIWLGIIKKSGIPQDQIQAMEFAQSRSEARKEGKTNVTFKDVAALGSVVEELEEVVAFLKDPKRFNSVGARPPKGLLLEGGPGVGKTLIAKAVAGEAGVPFYSMSGSEFVEIIVGVGAARVRDLFKRARVNAPCLIFVDEIDAMGGKRAPAMMRGNEEREQTLNQLLTEMDGFTPDTGVIFIGATNRADLLDPALLRPGRFDRKVTVLKPTTQGRADILRVHAKKIKLNPEVDLDQLARDLPGLSGAELANVLNEAALCALRRGGTPEEGVCVPDVYAAVDRIQQGIERTALGKHLPVVRRLACHEAGHALVATMLRQQNHLLEPVERVSIQPRGDEWTRTLYLRGDDETYCMSTRARMLDRLKVMLAGRAAEEVMYTDPSTHALGDMVDATVLARRMVTNYAFSSEMGLTTFRDTPTPASTGSVYTSWKKLAAQLEGPDLSMLNAETLPPSNDEMSAAYQAADDLVREAYGENVAMLTACKEALEVTTELLLEKEQIMGEELEQVIQKNPSAASVV